MRHKLHRLINDFRRNRDRKMVKALDAALILAAILIVLTVAEIGAAR